MRFELREDGIYENGSLVLYQTSPHVIVDLLNSAYFAGLEDCRNQRNTASGIVNKL